MELSSKIATQRILMLVDWLPPDFGAVGQYAVSFATALAEAGHSVSLVGFSSSAASEDCSAIGLGSLRVRKLLRTATNRQSLLQRALWTLSANTALLWGARDLLRSCDEIRFTGSPPYFLHFVLPLAKLLGKRTRYRITDFHPECLIAARDGRVGLLGPLRALTRFWRRRVDVIEVIGEDQRRRLHASRVPDAQIALSRDPSPVLFDANTVAAAKPAALAQRKAVLYSGNWGVAHDTDTFVQGFAQFQHRHPGRAGLWLNATGTKATMVAAAMAEKQLPCVHTAPVPLAELAGVLKAADVHLITLIDHFVGYVMPSKVYACIASGRPILFVGSAESDVHLLCAQSLPSTHYRRVAVGDAAGIASALDALLQVETSQLLE